ncbi:MAG: 3-methyl-2-oxobutanoate hydroxymethyltransferase [Verrucomicrobia bacterium]|nr:3-methyl-2-oxobutanoate hydroxymethyltransferase [Verrucomicrobiota bacterium]
MKSVLEFQSKKAQGEPISMVTCYDTWSAKIINDSAIDCILIGDSASMVMHGHPSTVHAHVDMMSAHVQAVSRGAPNKFLIGDIPFLAHRKGFEPLMNTVEILMKAGANSVKLEGARGHLEEISHIVESGVPVMGHLGLTPQSVNQLGGFKVQGKGEETARQIFEDAKALEQAGCFSMVLECIPAPLALEITDALSIPTIGIGSGPDTSGQVLVLQDMLGMDPGFQPKFVRRYLDGYQLIKDAVNHFDADVKAGNFPVKKESFV